LKQEFFEHSHLFTRDIGYEVLLPKAEYAFSAEERDNIVNLKGNGLMLELSQGLREKFFLSPQRMGDPTHRREKSDLFYEFIEMLRKFIMNI
jgi:phage replication-related protein YjqB (UPF0714/DUF867 family)